MNLGLSMRSIGRLTIVVSAALFIFAPLGTNAQTCQPSVVQTLGNDPHHSTVAGGNGGTGDGSQLAAHDTIVISAWAEGDPGYSASTYTTTPGPCRSIVNNSAISYFVPWHSPHEFQKFLSASLPSVSVEACCPPTQQRRSAETQSAS